MRCCLLLSILCALPLHLAAASPLADARSSVVRLRAVQADGTASFGSAVVVGPEQLATACHVTRAARSIEVFHGTQRWVVQRQAGSVEHDLCVLSVTGLNLPPVRTRASTALQPHEPVVAIGHPGGGELVVNEGRVEGLYDYDGARVIRTSAAFDFGASGGGLFDQAGNLVGLLAFKSKRGERLGFALPLDWLANGARVAARLAPVDATPTSVAFWERDKAEQPAFLHAAIVEATSERQPYRR